MNALALAIPQPENVQRRPKKTYATGVIRAFRNGNLPAHISRSIPGSTRSDWRRRDLSNIVGFVEPEFTDGFSNPLLHWHNRMAQRSEAALKVMLRFYQQVVLSVRGSKRIWREQKHRIVGLIERIAPIIGLDTACELLNLTQQRFYRWKNERPCNNDVFGRCGRAHPGRLTPAEQAVVKEYVTDEATKNWPLSNRFSKMMRDGAAFMNLQTFYRYARAFGPIFEQFKKPKHGVGVRASRPFEILHIDVTILRLRNGSRVFIQFIVDNFSRAILGWKAESFYYSGFTAENLRSVCEKFGLLRLPGNSKVLLVCDGGSENAGESDQFIMNCYDKIEKVVAQVDRLYSNSMSESANKCMKYQFLFRRLDHLHSVEHVRQALTKDVLEFNDRPTRVLHTLTPNEVLGGLIPDKKMYAEQIKAARARRYEVNSHSGCGVC